MNPGRSGHYRRRVHSSCSLPRQPTAFIGLRSSKRGSRRDIGYTCRQCHRNPESFLGNSSLYSRRLRTFRQRRSFSIQIDLGAQDITTFARLCCARLRTLSRLTSLTIKGAFCLDETLAKLLFNTLAHSPLRHFEVLSTIVCPQLGESFWTRMVEDHGAHLRTVSVHFPPLSISAVQEVCRGCVQLEELYVEVEVEVEVATDTLGGDPLARLFRHMARLLNGLADGLSLAPHLRRVHFKLRCHHGMHPTWLAGPDCSQAILDVVRRCSSRLTLIGLNSKAWRVRSSHLQKHLKTDWLIC
jgi:hypothetical protein